ncbi:MAG: response regulator [Zetaproteobacteria bacterium]|nr:MAG: response regulator [Zetaproteobacteria bacterium]
MHEIMSAFLRRYAQERGIADMRVTCISDPVEGLFEVTTNGAHYDIILLDIRMPRLTGDEIYNSIIHIKPELLQRIMFVTGYRQDLQGRFTDQSLRILDKPFRYAVLAEAIDEMRAALQR